MATANVRSVMRVPGRLCINPTNIANDFPHGGTALGLTRDVEFRIGITTGIVTAEEWGNIPVEAIKTAEACVLACVLREWDDDAIGAMFVNTSISSAGDRSILSRVATDGVRAGALLSAKAAVVVFSPLAPDDHPMIIIRKGLPLVDETAMLQASLAEEFGIAVVWQGIPDSSERLYDIGKRGDLSL